MPRVNIGVVPPFGFRFPRNWPNEDDQWISSDTFEHLVRDVTNHRVANQLPVNSPSNDIEGYICGKYPQNCSDTLSQSVTPRVPVEQLADRNLRERVTQWAANRYNSIGAIELVEQPEAERRAKICLTCPENQEWKIGCPPCIDSTERNLLLIRQAKTLPSQDQLKGCAISGHDNLTACFLPQEQLKHRVQTSDKLPSHCWMLELDKKE